MMQNYVQYVISFSKSDSSLDWSTSIMFSQKPNVILVDYQTPTICFRNLLSLRWDFGVFNCSSKLKNSPSPVSWRWCAGKVILILQKERFGPTNRSFTKFDLDCRRKKELSHMQEEVVNNHCSKPSFGLCWVCLISTFLILLALLVGDFNSCIQITFVKL